MAAGKKRKESKLNSAAEELIRLAEEGGVEQNFFFTTTFNRYKVQLNLLTRLQKEIDENGMLVKKEYVKGRENLVSNPAITEYNKTATAANQTVSTLIKIISTFSSGPIMTGGSLDDGEIDL